MSLTPEQRRALELHLARNFEPYAQRILRIIPKQGGNPLPFLLNDAQRYLHEKIEAQRRSIGKVRAIVLKGRQQGISTYTEGRYYWRITHSRGKRAFILTHEQKATDNLFAMVSRFYENAPHDARPHLGASNAKELVFDRLDCKYTIATAGARATGRSATAQLFHGSEVAFWPDAANHLAGIGQTLPDAPGTESILESTANGTANVFHELWQAAVRGESEYVSVFIPWFWQREYTRDVPPGFELDEAEEEYRATYMLTLGQMAWRRNKIATDFRGDVSLFDQEYPASAELAFASSSPRALIPVLLVSAARRAKNVEGIGPLIMGVDPAEYGNDFTSVWLRRGRVAWRVGKWNGLGPMETAGKVGLLIEKFAPERVFVDATNSAGIADRLKEESYPAIRIHFGEGAIDDKLYLTRRDELWGDMLEWFQDKPASIPDEDDVAAQLTSVQYSYDSKRRKKLEPKEKMFERGLKSPDDADALALTFAKGGVGSAKSAQAFKGRKRYA